MISKFCKNFNWVLDAFFWLLSLSYFLNWCFRFDDSGISPLTVKALTAAGYAVMTRVQEDTLSVFLEGKLLSFFLLCSCFCIYQQDVFIHVNCKKVEGCMEGLSIDVNYKCLLCLRP